MLFPFKKHYVVLFSQRFKITTSLFQLTSTNWLAVLNSYRTHPVCEKDKKWTERCVLKAVEQLLRAMHYSHQSQRCTLYKG